MRGWKQIKFLTCNEQKDPSVYLDLSKITPGDSAEKKINYLFREVEPPSGVRTLQAKKDPSFHLSLSKYAWRDSNPRPSGS